MVSRLDVSTKFINIKKLLTNLLIMMILFSYYDMPVDEIRKLINAIDNNNKTEFLSPLPISKELRELLKIPEPNESIDELKKQNNELKQQIKDENNELKQQIKEMQELLNNFIKNSSSNNSN